MEQDAVDLLAETLEHAANFLRGVALDPRVPGEVQEALRERAADLDAVLEPLDL